MLARMDKGFRNAPVIIFRTFISKFKKIMALAARQYLLDMTQRLHPRNLNSTVAETRHRVDTPMWTREISQGPTLDEEIRQSMS